jgi:hypothetical protein
MNLFSKIFQSRKWTFGLAGAIISLGNAVGWWNIPEDKLYPLLGAIGVPIIGESLTDLVPRPKGDIK